MLDDLERLLARLALGGSIAAHGAQKAWGAFDGPGPQGAAAFMESLGFVPGARYATAASGTELLAGVLIGLGFGGAVGPAALISTMIVAQTTVHAKNGYFAQQNGIELGVLYATAALALASGGYGRFSLDEALGWTQLRDPRVAALMLGGGIAGALIVLAQRASTDGSAPGGAASAPNASTSPAADTTNAGETSAPHSAPSS